MQRFTAVFLGIFAVGCSQEVDDHTHDLLQHDHDHQHPFVNHSHAGETQDTIIVSIDWTQLWWAGHLAPHRKAVAPPVTPKGKLATLWGELKAGQNTKR